MRRQSLWTWGSSAGIPSAPLRLAGEAVIGRVGNVLEHVAVLGNGLPGPAAHPVIEPAINGPSLRRRRPGQLRCCRSSRQVPE
jgi:hypothetical protein